MVDNHTGSEVRAAHCRAFYIVHRTDQARAVEATTSKPHHFIATFKDHSYAVSYKAARIILCFLFILSSTLPLL